MPAECGSPQPLFKLPIMPCSGSRGGVLTSKSEGAGGSFCRWIVNGAFCGGIGDAGPLHRCSLAGWGAGSRGARVDGGHGRKGHSLDGAPLTGGKLLQALQALRGTLIAHVEPQGLMRLAVVHNGLLVPVEGQSAHLMRNLWRKKRKNEQN